MEPAGIMIAHSFHNHYPLHKKNKIHTHPHTLCTSSNICFPQVQGTSHICLVGLGRCSYVDLGSMDRPKNKQLKNSPACLFP